jgi:hypothetical protein
MENFQRFIRIDDDRINATEIVCYGIDTDDDDDRYLYVETKTSEDIFRYYEENVDFDLEEKLGELDGLFLIRPLGRVDFKRK